MPKLCCCETRKQTESTTTVHNVASLYEHSLCTQSSFIFRQEMLLCCSGASVSLSEQLASSILGRPAWEVTQIPELEKSTTTQETSLQCSYDQLLALIPFPTDQPGILTFVLSARIGFFLPATKAVDLRRDQHQLPITWETSNVTTNKGTA